LNEQENIKRNKLRLAALDLPKPVEPVPKRTTTSTPKKRKSKEQLEPVRRSTREKSQNVNYNFDAYDKVLNAAERAFEGKSASMGYIVPNLDENLMTCEEYCEAKGFKNGLKIERDFEGWVEEKTRKELNFAPTQEEHWESMGVSGPREAVGRIGKSSNAKEHSKKCLHTNPNMYFYRHCKPGEEPKWGPWEEDEIQLFLETAKKYGAGDNWGLFSSFIPGRVGYSCNQAYRSIMLPRGLILDDHYLMTESGKTVIRKKRTGLKKYSC
jgi:hypothetical protein